MKSFMVPIVCICACYCVCFYGGNASSRSAKEPLVDLRCDSGGYYFDRGGRRMFETSYDSYQKGTFNLRRGHLWKDQSCRNERCRHVHRARQCQCTVTEPSACTQESNMQHKHYSAQEGLTRWPSSTGPDNWQAGTKGYPYVETPIWMRDTSGASGYATPTSWQGFQ